MSQEPSPEQTNFVAHIHSSDGRAGVVLGQYSLIGAYASDSVFVRHVAILSRSLEATETYTEHVHHVGPPIFAGEASYAEAPGRFAGCNTDVLADIGLSRSERDSIETWLASIDGQIRPAEIFQQYILIPRSKLEVSEIGRPIYYRFSCAGFVHAAYEAADIWMVTEDSNLPAISEAELRSMYPDLFNIETRSERVRASIGFKGRADLGLDDSGEWKVLLPGYLFNSLARYQPNTERPEPFQPTSVEDASFPSEND